ncbi:MAG: TrkH family potassium uptake protein [Bacteroidales bacterium]|nr:TrkH family potassium uptake protein [Bacteroidales bacterium]
MARQGIIRRLNLRLIARLTGLLLLMEAVALLLPIAVAAIEGDEVLWGLAASALFAAVVGLLLCHVVGRGAVYEVHERESFWMTSVVWLLVPLMGALPYVATRTMPSAIDAVFESFSGFTTTGASTLSNPRQLPDSLLVWRALTQWIGGMGLILFVVAVFRRIHGGSISLYDAEFSGTVQRRLHPHIATTVRSMWAVYVGETLLLVVILLLLGNNWLDAFCLGCCTVSTGGFMTAADGLSSLSHASQSVIALFMFISGVNLALLYNLFSLKWSRLRQSHEFRTYLLLFLLFAIFTAVALVMKGGPVWASIRYACFHVASMISTCGYFIIPPISTPFVVIAFTFLLILIGACTGSTGGGIKVKRVMIVTRYIKNYFTRMVHPRVVFNVKVDGIVISDDYNNKVFAFVFMYAVFVLGGAFAMSLAGVDFEPALSMSMANMANLGPVPITGDLGVMFSYAMLPDMAKAVLMVLMVAGRIEIFALVAVFSRSYWRRR